MAMLMPSLAALAGEVLLQQQRHCALRWRWQGHGTHRTTPQQTQQTSL